MAGAVPPDDELSRLVPTGTVERTPTVFVLGRDGVLRGTVTARPDGPWEVVLADMLADPEGG
jgi:hypothetical protein